MLLPTLHRDLENSQVYRLMLIIALCGATSSCHMDARAPHDLHTTQVFITSATPLTFPLGPSPGALQLTIQPVLTKTVTLSDYRGHPWCLTYQVLGSKGEVLQSETLHGMATLMETFDEAGQLAMNEKLVDFPGQLLGKEILPIDVVKGARSLTVASCSAAEDVTLLYRVASPSRVAAIRRHSYWGTMDQAQRVLLSSSLSPADLQSREKRLLSARHDRMLAPRDNGKVRFVKIDVRALKAKEISRPANSIQLQLIDKQMPLAVRTLRRGAQIRYRIIALMVTKTDLPTTVTWTDTNDRPIESAVLETSRLPAERTLTVRAPGYYMIRASQPVYLEVTQTDEVTFGHPPRLGQLVMKDTRLEYVVPPGSRYLRIQSASLANQGTTRLTKFCSGKPCGSIDIPLRAVSSSCCRIVANHRFGSVRHMASKSLLVSEDVTSIVVDPTSDQLISIRQFSPSPQLQIDIPSHMASDDQIATTFDHLESSGAPEPGQFVSVIPESLALGLPPGSEKVIHPETEIPAFVETNQEDPELYTPLEFKAGCHQTSLSRMRPYAPLRLEATTSGGELRFTQDGRTFFKRSQTATASSATLDPNAFDSSRPVEVCFTAPTTLWIKDLSRKGIPRGRYAKKFFAAVPPVALHQISHRGIGDELLLDILIDAQLKDTVNLVIDIDRPQSRQINVKLHPIGASRAFLVRAGPSQEVRRYTFAIDLPEGKLGSQILSLRSSHPLLLQDALRDRDRETALAWGASVRSE